MVLIEEIAYIIVFFFFLKVYLRIEQVTTAIPMLLLPCYLASIALYPTRPLTVGVLPSLRFCSYWCATEDIFVLIRKTCIIFTKPYFSTTPNMNKLLSLQHKTRNTLHLGHTYRGKRDILKTENHIIVH